MEVAALSLCFTDGATLTRESYLCTFLSLMVRSGVNFCERYSACVNHLPSRKTTIIWKLSNKYRNLLWRFSQTDGRRKVNTKDCWKKTFFKLNVRVYLRFVLCVYVRICHMCGRIQGDQNRELYLLELELQVLGGGLNGRWQWNFSPLEDQQVLLTRELSLQFLDTPLILME